jgi:hypothetical protein
VRHRRIAPCLLKNDVIGGGGRAKRSPVGDGVAFTGEGKLVRKATGYEQEKAEAALSHIAFAGCASRPSGAHWSVSVTHRFLRRGRKDNRGIQKDITTPRLSRFVTQYVRETGIKNRLLNLHDGASAMRLFLLIHHLAV